MSGIVLLNRSREQFGVLVAFRPSSFALELQENWLNARYDLDSFSGDSSLGLALIRNPQVTQNGADLRHLRCVRYLTLRRTPHTVRAIAGSSHEKSQRKVKPA